MNTIKSKLYYFHLDKSDPAQLKQYEEQVRPAMLATGFPVDVVNMQFYTANPEGWKFKDRLAKSAGHVVNSKGIVTCDVELETKLLFADQWNSAPFGEFETGARLFNAVEHKYPNADIVTGYWLDQTREMASALVDNHKCGYCGAMEPASKGLKFCSHCIDSEYLEADSLHLTRMVAVRDSFDAVRKPLTKEEKAERLPLYKEAQRIGATERGKARIAKERADLKRDFDKTVKEATIKFRAYSDLMDMGLKTENVIYYSHRGIFTFGWRKPLSKDQVEEVLAVTDGFKFKYEILCADGKLLSSKE